MKIFEGLGCVTSNKRLEFGDDAITIRIMTQIQEFLKEFFRCGIGAIVRIFADQLQKLSTHCYEIFNMDVMCGWQKRLDFGADPDHDPDQGIFNGIFVPLQDVGNCKNFAGSAALAEVRSLPMFLVS